MFLVLGSSELDAVLQLRPYQCRAERKDHFPRSTQSPSLGYCWPPLQQGCMAGLWSACRPPRPQGLPWKICLLAGWPPAHTGAWGYASPSAGLCISPCWTLVTFLPAQFSSISQYLWMASEPSGISAIPPAFGLKNTMYWIWFIQWFPSIQSL